MPCGSNASTLPLGPSTRTVEWFPAGLTVYFTPAGSSIGFFPIRDIVNPFVACESPRLTPHVPLQPLLLKSQLAIEASARSVSARAACTTRLRRESRRQRLHDAPAGRSSRHAEWS